MTVALEGGEWSVARPRRTLPSGKTRYPFYRRLGGPQSRSGQAENLVPIGIRSRSVQPVVSHYTDWATRPTHTHTHTRPHTQTHTHTHTHTYIYFFFRKVLYSFVECTVIDWLYRWNSWPSEIRSIVEKLDIKYLAVWTNGFIYECQWR